MGKKLTLSFLLLAFAELIYNISAYVIHAGLGRILGPQEYGRYSLIIGVTTMVTILVARGIPTSMAKRISEVRDNIAQAHAIKKTAAKMQLIAIALLTSIFYLSAPLIAHIFSDPTLTPLFRLSSLVIPAFALSSFHVLYFNGLKSFKAMTALKISRGVFRMLWIVGLGYLFFTHGAIWGAILAPLSVAALAMIIEYVYLRPLHKKHRQEEIAPYPWKNLLSYASSFMLFLFFYEFYVRTDIYMIKSLLQDDTLMGLYNAAMTITLIPYYAIFALTFVLFPTMSDLTKNGEWGKAKTIIKNALLFMFGTLPIAALILYFFREQITVLFFGKEFIEAAQFIPFMLGGTIFGTVFYILASVLNGSGYTYVTAGIVCVAIIVTVALNVTLLPLYGAKAAAIIFSSTSAFMAIAALIATHIIFSKNKNT